MPLLVGTPRYYLSIVPLFYLATAYGVDSILRAFNRFRWEPVLIVTAGMVLCRPNLIAPRPNFEMTALRRIAPCVKAHPVIAAWWAGPDVVFGSYGDAEAASIGGGFRWEDIANGRIDILMLDGNFRQTRAWAQQRGFFRGFRASAEELWFYEIGWNLSRAIRYLLQTQGVLMLSGLAQQPQGRFDAAARRCERYRARWAHLAQRVR